MYSLKDCALHMNELTNVLTEPGSHRGAPPEHLLVVKISLSYLSENKQNYMCVFLKSSSTLIKTELCGREGKVSVSVDVDSSCDPCYT